MQLEAVTGDLTTQDVDAIVNAANSSLLGGGGVDGAIHRAAGPDLLTACQQIRQTSYPSGLPTGHAVTTRGARLPARYVIHTVGPDARRGQTDPELLASCFRRSLDEAWQVVARSVAFPAVSGGVFGWAMADIARIAVAAVRDWDRQHPDSGIDLVRFVLFSPDATKCFEAALS